MTRTIKLLTALCAFGCGGAMASPDHGQYGQWTGYGPGYYSNDPSNDSNAPGNELATPTPTQPSMPQPPGEDEGLPPSSQSPAQGGYHSEDAEAQDQNPYQDQDEDRDENAIESQNQDKVRLGVLVLALTTELRQFFGAPADRGVLIAKVEPGSAAQRAGIQVGDVLVRVGPRQVRSGDDVVQALAARQGGRTRIALIRRGARVQLIAFLPAPPSISGEHRL